MQTEFHIFEEGEARLHYAALGRADAPALICLHGFPEYWAGFRDIMPLLAQRFRVYAPDQRGYNLSFKPKGVDAYAAGHLAGDIARFIDHVSPVRPVLLFGHDWGASVAYAYAFRHPERLSGLVIANGIHPVTFQRALLYDEGQREASYYIPRLRKPGVETVLEEDDYARTFNMIGGFSSSDWLSEDVKQGYRDAWSQPGAMEAMVNWYRASPLVAPASDADPAEIERQAERLLDIPAEHVTVRVPHLVVWGVDDAALKDVCLDGLEDFAPDLEIHRMEGTGHWLLHEKPKEVSDVIFDWLDRKGIVSGRA